MYDYKPTRTNPFATLLMLGFLLLSIASFVASAFLPSPFAYMLQVVGVILLMPAIQLVTRYTVNRILYRIMPYEDGNTDLDIYFYRGGTKMQLVGRIGLEEITAAAPLTDANRKPPKGIRRYNYSPDIRPANGLVLSITNSDGDCEILLCPDERLTAILTPREGETRTYVPETGTTYGEADDTAAETGSASAADDR